MSENVLPTEWAMGVCKFGMHDSCYGKYAETVSKDGEPVAERRCPCECHRKTDEGVPA